MHAVCYRIVADFLGTPVQANLSSASAQRSILVNLLVPIMARAVVSPASDRVAPIVACPGLTPPPMIRGESRSMADKTSSSVSPSRVADVTENRRRSEAEKKWADHTLLASLEKSPEKPLGAASGINLDQGRARFTTISGAPVRRLYTAADLPEDWTDEKYLGFPGQPPFTRGIHATGYRGKLFTMRQFSGFASP